MGIYSEIVEWAQERSWWQQEALSKIIAGQKLTDEDISEFVDRLLVDEPEDDIRASLPRQPESLGQEASKIDLRSLSNLKNVNRIDSQQELEFSPTGLTIVYGNNGSGKSGYARLVKALVRARVSKNILPNVFAPEQGDPEATLCYLQDGKDRALRLERNPETTLRQVAFYDEECGEQYVRQKGEITFRPDALRLLDDLIGVCSRLDAEAKSRIEKLEQKRLEVPEILPETSSYRFFDELNASTTDADIAEAAKFTQKDQEQLDHLEQESTRLQRLDPKIEWQRVDKYEKSCQALAKSLESINKSLGSQAADCLSESRRNLASNRELAASIANASFENEPVKGVGSLFWKNLWSAAKAFSESVAYPDHEFPHMEDGALCVLCHQELDSSAKERFERFTAFLEDSTESAYQDSLNEVSEAVAAINSCDIESSTAAVALEALNENDSDLSAKISSEFEVWAARKSALLSESEIPALPTGGLLKRLKDRALELGEAKKSIDQERFDAQFRKISTELHELKSRKALTDACSRVKEERDRQRAVQKLNEVQRTASTTGISRFIGKLSDCYINDRARQDFANWADKFGVRSVAYERVGSGKGKIYHQPLLEGVVRRVDVHDVLSEGEQTALGLAGFLVEVNLDESGSAVVFDDPVTSMDHLNRGLVADVLAEMAKHRQVIVFTHDSVFSMELMRCSKRYAVGVGRMTVSRSVDGVSVGIVKKGHPWELRDSGERIDCLRKRLAALKRDVVSQTIDDDEYAEQVSSWAGRFSQTWERIVSQDVAGRIYDRGSLQVKIGMVKVAAGITQEDNSILQDSYSRCSGWVRHDVDPEVNYQPPSIDVLERELDTMDQWRRRVRGYGTTGSVS